MLTNDCVPGLIFYYLPRGEKYIKFLALVSSIPPFLSIVKINKKSNIKKLNDMTHSFNTSVLQSSRHLSQNFYQVEIQDFNDEYTSFEIQAANFESANNKASRMAAEQGIDIYNMNVYRI